MAENSPQYPAPETPRSFREVLEKALDDPDYAAFIHDEVRLARTAETEQEKQAAVDTIDSHFALSSEELTTLGLPAGFPSSGPCRCTETRTTLFLLDFATKTASWSPEQSSGS